MYIGQYLSIGYEKIGRGGDCGTCKTENGPGPLGDTTNGYNWADSIR